MQFDLSLANIFGLIAGGAGAMLALVLIHAYQHKTLWLAAFVGTFSYALFAGVVRSVELPAKLGLLFDVLAAVNFLSAPFLYFYVCDVLGQKAFRRWFHMVPAGLASGAIMVWPDVDRLLLYWLVLLQAAMYLTYLLLKVNVFRRRLRQQFSNLVNIDLLWLLLMIAALLVLALFDTFAFPLLRYFGFSVSAGQATFNFLGTLYLFWLARGATGQQFAAIDQSVEYKPAKRTAYEGSSLDAESARVLAENLRAIMKDQELYLHQDLTLKTLSDAAGMSTHVTSEVLNNTIGQSFYDFVNEHRIGVAKRQLQGTDLSILEIAFASGFNNKVSFNKAFRKFVSITPSEFRKQEHQQL